MRRKVKNVALDAAEPMQGKDGAGEHQHARRSVVVWLPPGSQPLHSRPSLNIYARIAPVTALNQPRQASYLLRALQSRASIACSPGALGPPCDSMIDDV